MPLNDGTFTFSWIPLESVTVIFVPSATVKPLFLDWLIDTSFLTPSVRPPYLNVQVKLIDLHLFVISFLLNPIKLGVVILFPFEIVNTIVSFSVIFSPGLGLILINSPLLIVVENSKFSTYSILLLVAHNLNSLISFTSGIIKLPLDIVIINSVPSSIISFSSLLALINFPFS